MSSMLVRFFFVFRADCFLFWIHLFHSLGEPFICLNRFHIACTLSEIDAINIWNRIYDFPNVFYTHSNTHSHTHTSICSQKFIESRKWSCNVCFFVRLWQYCSNAFPFLFTLNVRAIFHTGRLERTDGQCLEKQFMLTNWNNYKWVIFFIWMASCAQHTFAHTSKDLALLLIMLKTVCMHVENRAANGYQ